MANFTLIYNTYRSLEFSMRVNNLEITINHTIAFIANVSTSRV